MADPTDIVSVTRAIERDRATLVADLEELGLTLRRRLDPREHIRAHPRAALIFAFAAGVLVRVLFFRERSR